MKRLTWLFATGLLLAVFACAVSTDQTPIPPTAPASGTAQAYETSPPPTLLLPDDYGQFHCRSLVSDSELANFLNAPGIGLQPTVQAPADGYTFCPYGFAAQPFPRLKITVVTRPTGFLSPRDLPGEPVAGLGRWAVLRHTRVDASGAAIFDLYVGGTCNQVELVLGTDGSGTLLPVDPITVITAIAMLVFERIDCAPN
jgi:hypothetical protein